MSDLPPGWEWTTLGDIAESVKNGIYISRPGAMPDGVPILRINAVRPAELRLDEIRYSGKGIENLQSEGALLKPGDLLFTRYSGSRDYVGVCAITPDNVGPLTYPDKLIRVRLKEVEPKYAMFAFSSPPVRSVVESSLRTTAGQVGISGTNLKAVRIPLAPLAEQRRIVAALDGHLSLLAEGNRYIGRGLRRLCELDLMLLRSAIERPERHWDEKSIGELADVSSGATPNRGCDEYYDGGIIPWITSSQLNQPFVRSAEKFITQKALQDTSLKFLEPGTLLLAMYGEGKTRGKCSELKIRATTNQACAAIALKPDHIELRPWLKMTLTARYESNRRLSSGGVQPNLNLGLIKDMVVSIPPAEERSEILEQLEIGRTAQLHLASELAEIRTRANALRRALLVEAFTGRLVPQNPSDEPASVLLEQIRTEQTAGAKTRRARHTAKNADPEQKSML